MALSLWHSVMPSLVMLFVLLYSVMPWFLRVYRRASVQASRGSPKPSAGSTYLVLPVALPRARCLDGGDVRRRPPIAGRAVSGFALEQGEARACGFHGEPGFATMFRNYFPSNLDGSAQTAARVSVSLPSRKPFTSQTDSH